MNERIQQLAEQAGFENGHQDRDSRSLSDELEKFAELIVQECADIVIKVGSEQLEDKDAVIYSGAIKGHFGVKE